MTENTQATSVAEKPPENATVTSSSALTQEEIDRLSDGIIAAIKTVYDPEIPADIYELGLIYKIDIDDDRNVDVHVASGTAVAEREVLGALGADHDPVELQARPAARVGANPRRGQPVLHHEDGGRRPQGQSPG